MQNKFKKYLVVSFIPIFSLLRSQVVNYVNNPSFETFVSNGFNTPFNSAKYWSSTDSSMTAYYVWGPPPIGPMPYCSTGFQYPRTGNNFILTQFFCNGWGRLYPRNWLKQGLKSNTKYCAKYYIVNTNNNYITIENYGVYFGDSTLDTISSYGSVLNYLTPHIEYTGPIITDTLNWTPITGTFVASGTEKYMLLGNFKSNPSTNTLILHTPTLSTMTNDLYIDDVSLIEMDLPAFAGRDTVVYPGDSVFIGREPDVGIDEACVWYKLPNTTNPIDTIAGFWINPTSTSTYVVKQQLWCSNEPKWDTVVVQTSIYVGNDELRLLNEGLELFPNPADNFLEIKISDARLLNDFKTIRIFDHLGQIVKEEEFKIKAEVKFEIGDLPEGVYFLELNGNQGIARKRFVVAH